MENQHRKITGYRELDQEEIDGMNEVKKIGFELDHLLEGLLRNGADARWIAIAKTDLQKGLMAATRSVAKPEFF